MLVLVVVVQVMLMLRVFIPSRWSLSTRGIVQKALSRAKQPLMDYELRPFMTDFGSSTIYNLRSPSVLSAARYRATLGSLYVSLSLK